MQKMRKVLKNERGLTLVELLAVVVILGIISAIAIPSVGGLIDNSKKDAHIANAQQMVNSAKLKVVGQESDNATTITLKTLIDEGYIEDMKDPSGTTYNQSASTVTITPTGNTFNYTVIMKSKDTNVQYLSGNIDDIERKDVKLK